MNKNWFEDWFDSPYYHILYRDRDEIEAREFIDHLCKHLKIKKDAKILDLACGKGRHALHLAKKGFQTVGIDLSKESIKEATKNAVSNVIFEVHDMQKTYKAQHFNYVFNLFTSFGYFDKQSQNENVLKAAAANLCPEGVFVLDFMNVTKVIANLVNKETKTLSGLTFDISRSYNGNQLIKNILVKKGNEKISFQERVAAYTLNTINDMANKAGLRIMEIYGDYHLKSFDEKHSNRLILIMKLNH